MQAKKPFLGTNYVAYPDRTSYAGWRRCLSPHKRIGIFPNYWPLVQKDFDDIEQEAILEAITVIGIPVSDWNRTFLWIWENKEYLQFTQSPLTWRIFAQELTTEQFPVIHYLPCPRPDWLISLCNFSQSQYLADLTVYWDNIDRDGPYYIPWGSCAAELDMAIPTTSTRFARPLGSPILHYGANS